MTDATETDLTDTDAWTTRPRLQCDVVMKGGITSGVVYPQALSELAKNYELRGLGGASAGAIGAALGAAAEFGRASGGFAKLHDLPLEVDLEALFQAQPATRPLLNAVKSAIAERGTGARVRATVVSLIRAFWWQAILGVLLPLVAITAGIVLGWATGWPLVVAGLVLLPIGLAAALLIPAWRVLTVAVPANLLGVCTGHNDDPATPAITDWLADKIDLLAGLEARTAPLTFGQLRRPTAEMIAAGDELPRIDLRMVTTCLSQSAAYELPLSARSFFYDEIEWAKLFPAYVMRALHAAPVGPPAELDASAIKRWRADNRAASAHTPPLRRLPVTEDLPVIVATRMSLSFPLLISAVPLYTANRRATGPTFLPLWFSDGGFTSNFPVSMFDAPLPTRPTFAINLGRFPDDQEPSDDEYGNIEYARTNNDALLPPHRDIPESGFGAISGFAAAAFDSARSWQDNSYLRVPGYRDRIVRVLQTKDEGGLNLQMESAVVERLAERGRTAAEAISEQFRGEHYGSGMYAKTGWQNHRWLRYRALMAGMPTFLDGYARGRAIKPTLRNEGQVSYKLSVPGRAVANRIAKGLDEIAAQTGNAPDAAVADVTSAPNPSTVIRRVPRM